MSHAPNSESDALSDTFSESDLRPDGSLPLTMDNQPQLAEPLSKPVSPVESYGSLHENSWVNGYELQERLGEGGCGVVFRATVSATPSKMFALKFVRPARLSEQNVAQRFQQEISIARRLEHPNLVAATDSGAWHGISYLVMEYVRGLAVDRVIKQQPRLAVADTCEIVRQAALGLQFVHESGCVHRDIKPSNLMLSVDGVVKITDFGMAGLKDVDPEVSRLTSWGEGLGTPDYMAPEQWVNARDADIRADIYSLGCTLFCLLAGRPPFDDDRNRSALSKMRAHQDVPPPDLAVKRAEIAAALVSILTKCLQKDRNQRWATPAELVTALSPFCDGADLTRLTARVAAVPNTETHAAESKPPSDLTANSHDPLTGPEDPNQTIHESPSKLGDVTDHMTHGEFDAEGTLGEAASGQEPGPATLGSIVGSITKSFSTVHLRQRDLSGKRQQGAPPEFEITGLLGEGGMGSVYEARQGSLDRSVAVKVLKPAAKKSQDRQEKFVAEAVITGDLEHPSIIPVYDVGTNAAGEVFYAMKKVQGAAWKDRLEEQSEIENIETLLRVADAVAFAHERGVVHRDLKPENVMLGGYGEVLVVDWGLAYTLPGFSKPNVRCVTGTVGTLAYMPPELAEGDAKKISPAIDTYLLGAILFRILVGKPPHTGRNVPECLRNAASNVIVPADRDDELITIARRAMATLPSDRYASVKDFQQAIREYFLHVESHRLTHTGEHELQTIDGTQAYRCFERAIAAFEAALETWNENDRARASLHRARYQYAQAAFQRSDFELAEQQLDVTDAQHAALAREIGVARAERDSRAARMRRFRRMAIGLAAGIFVVVSLASVIVHRFWRSEEAAHAEALQRFKESNQAIQRLTEFSRELENFPRLEGLREGLLKRAAAYYAELREKRSDDPDMQMQQASSLLQLGDVYELLLQHSKAEEAFDAVIETAKPLVHQSQRRDLRTESETLIAMSYLRLAQVSLAQSIHDDADRAVRHAQVWSAKNSSPQSLATRADVMVQQGRLKLLERDFAAAKQSFLAAAAMYEELSREPHSELSSNALKGAALAFDHALRCAESIGEFTEAERHATAAIAKWNALTKADATNPSYLEGLASSHVQLSNLMRHLGRDGEADAREAVESYGALLRARPEVPRYQFNLATEQTNLAFLANRAGASELAKSVAIEAINQLRGLQNKYAEEPEFADHEYIARSVLGEILRDQGEFKLAIEVFQESKDHFQDRATTFPHDVGYRERAIENQLLLAQSLWFSGDAHNAQLELTPALEAVEKLTETEPQATRPRDLAAGIHQLLATISAQLGDQAAAETHAKSTLEIRTALPPSPQFSHHFAQALLDGLPANFRDAKHALALMESATQQAPSNADYWLELALAQIANRDTEAAARSIKTAKQRRDEALKAYADHRLAEYKSIEPRRQVQTARVELVESLLLRQQARPQEADDMRTRATEALRQSAPGHPRWRRLMEPQP